MTAAQPPRPATRQRGYRTAFTIYKLVKKTLLKTIKLCGQRVVTRDSIEALLAGTNDS